MIKVVEIKTMNQVRKLAFEQERDKSISRLRNTFLYRGLQQDYPLLTSLQRNCVDKATELEPFLLRNFAKYVNIIDPSVDESQWRAMIVGQHHGLPTRLLDWTISVPMALNFATDESDLSEMDQHDCVVWRIDAKEINQHLPDRYKKAMLTKANVFTLKDLERVVVDIEQYDNEMSDKAFITLDPPSIDERIVNQFSYFTIMPSGINNLEDYLKKHTKRTVKYIIDKSLRWDIRDTLDQWNINERTVYPGKDGIAEWLKRYYYVKR